jgi:methionyl-tRNA synthetase
MLLYKGKKMSKSDNTGMSADSLLEKYSPDLIRFFFTRNSPENHDREFEWSDFIDCNNNELVANIGNFINRTLTFVNTKFNNTVPQGESDGIVLKNINNTFKNVGEYIEKCEFVKASEELLRLGDFANKYFNDKAPWLSYKSNIKDCENTIFNSIQLVNALRILLKPFTPNSSEKLKIMLNIQDEYDQNIDLEKNGNVSKIQNNWKFTQINSGTHLNTPEILFEKI